MKGALDGGLRLVEEMLCWNQSVMPVADKSDSYVLCIVAYQNRVVIQGR